LENGTAESTAIPIKYQERTGHLNAKHIEFFKHWDHLITLEEGDIRSARKELWSLSSKEREKLGRCFSGMKLIGSTTADNQSKGIGKYIYQFERAGLGSSLLESSILVSNPIVISSEENHYALALGFVTSITPTTITCSVDRQLDGIPKRLPSFNNELNQNFISKYPAFKNPDDFDSDGITLYRIDKDELSNGMGLIRDNLISIFKYNERDRYRKLIVDLATPFFSNNDHDLNRLEIEKSLNMDQKAAVEKVLKGMPLKFICL
jgi:DNA replication ATP-dependent helicase Dna2